VTELQGLSQAQLEDLLGPRGEGNVAAGRRTALADDLLDLIAHSLEADAEGLERFRGDALTLVDQAEQDVLRPDVVVVEQARFFLRQHHHSSSPVGEPLEHRYFPPRSGSFRRVYRRDSAENGRVGQLLRLPSADPGSV